MSKDTQLLPQLKVVSPESDHSTETVVLHAAYPIWRKHLLVAIARAKELQDQGTNVILTYCSAYNGTCAVNLVGNALTCAVCRSRVRQTAEQNGVTAVPLLTTESDGLTLSEKKDLAEGVKSAIISEFRQLPKEAAANPILRMVKRRYFKTSCGLLTAVRQLIQRTAPSRVEVFNGRHACSRFIITAANSASVPFNTLEVTGRGRPIVFEGHTAHSRVKLQERMMRIPVDLDTVDKWFERRRKPSANKFAKKHSVSFVPPDQGAFRRKVTIFLSSQDEFEALGSDWKSRFPNYDIVIRETCLKNPDYLFCIRFHPNQASMALDLKGMFADIESLPNTVVYYPLDTANTYTLISWSDFVVTFGSTVTAEACWAGIPAIMLGPSLYDQMGLSYNPRTMEEYFALLRQDLKPLPRDRAAPIAMYSELDGNPMRYLSHDGKTMVPNGVVLKQTVLSRIARTSDNLMIRLIRKISEWTFQKKKKSA
jgi:hypothetical protein